MSQEKNKPREALSSTEGQSLSHGPEALARSMPPWGRGTHRALAALAAAAIPAGTLVSVGGEAAATQVARFIASTPWPARLGYWGFVQVLRAAALFGKFRPLTKLSAAQASAFVKAWAGSKTFWKRSVMRAVLTPLKIAHFADPAQSRRLGYDPPPPAASAPLPKAYEACRPASSYAGDSLTADVVIIGSGPGGAVMATRLAEQGLGVVILEEGSLHTRRDFNRRPFQMSQKLYRDGGLTVALGVPGIPIPVGRTVGGTSTINSGTCYRIPEHILESWQQEHGLTHLTRELLAPHYDALEAFLRVQPVPEAVRGKVAEVIARGCDVLGYSHGPLHRNADGCEGSGVCCFGCPTGAKQSMERSFLPRALQHGAQLITGAHAEAILHSGGQARGVVAVDAGGGALTVRAKAVVVAAGSFGTPTLLMKNQLGRASGQLGKHLTIHPAAKAAALFEEDICSWEGVPQSHTIDQFHSEGLLFEGASVPPEYGAMALGEVGAEFTAMMEIYRKIAFFGFLIEDSGSGSVRPGPGGSYRIHYSCTKRDVERLRRGTRILGEVFFAAGAKKVFSPIAGIPDLNSADDLKRIDEAKLRPSQFELSAFHPLGTCRMGVSPKQSVIDPGHELWDLSGLFVADGSVFPSSLVVNPQMTIMATSSLAAEHVAARVGGSPRWKC